MDMGIEFTPKSATFVIEYLHGIEGELKVGDEVVAQAINVYADQQIILRNIIDQQLVEITGASVGGWLNGLLIEKGVLLTQDKQVKAFNDPIKH